jgi:hypothetical protein
MPEHYRIKATVEMVQWKPNRTEAREEALDWLRKYAAEFRYDERSDELYLLSHGKIVEMVHGDWFVRGHQGFIFRKTDADVEEHYEWAPPYFISIHDNHGWEWECILDHGEEIGWEPTSTWEETLQAARAHVRKYHP